jgi:glycosyltransferase involved in cell wall biosynthesis
MLNALEMHYGPLPRAAVAYNGCENRSASDASKQPFVFTSGRLWDAAKNVALLEAIAAKLPWPVYVAGENRHPDGGTRSHSDCHYLGRLSAQQMAWWMDRAAIYVLPARYEPFGLSILEAAQSGCALVLGDIPSLREIWDGAALFVSPSAAPVLQKTIFSLIQSPSLRVEMAGRARIHGKSFTSTRMVETYLAAYRAVLTGTASPMRA